jgi:hypothetical protein
MANDIGSLLSSKNRISPVLGHFGLLQNTFNTFESFLVCLAHIRHTGLQQVEQKIFDSFLVFLMHVRGTSKKVFGLYLVPLVRAWVLADISLVMPSAHLCLSPAPSPGQMGDQMYPLCVCKVYDKVSLCQTPHTTSIRKTPKNYYLPLLTY